MLELKSGKTRVSAPALPSETDLFWSFLFIKGVFFLFPWYEHIVLQLQVPKFPLDNQDDPREITMIKPYLVGDSGTVIALISTLGT